MLLILNAFTTLLVVVFIAYVFFILVPFLRYPKLTPGNAEDFEYHFFIPCRDEEVVIAKTIERARRDFPTAHVWVIDDDSDDQTATIANSYVAADEYVHVVQRRRPDARTGKGDALNAAYTQLNAWLPDDADRSNIIVTVIDADGELAENALDICASDEVFGDDRVGAVQVAVWMKNRADRNPFPDKGWFWNTTGRWVLRMQDLEFRTVIAGMQSLRARTGTVGLGGNGQLARLSTLDAIAKRYGEPWHGALLEDYELGLHVLLSGYTIKHVYDTHVSQEALPSIRRLLTQRTRWAQGNIQCIRYLPELVRSRYFDAAGLIEACYYLFLPFVQVIGAVSFLILGGGLFVEFLTDSAYRADQWGTMGWLAALSILFGIGPFILWGPVYKLRCEPHTSWPKAFLYGIGLWLYVYYTYVCIVRAFVRIIRGQNGWAKTRRNAEAHVVVNGSVAVEE